MNIFFLSLIPAEIAEMSCDQHVIKIQLEICQMLYTAWYFSSEENYVQENAPYTKDGKRRGIPCRTPKTSNDYMDWFESGNYIYACEIGMALTLEYTYRYGKIHTCAEHLTWLMNHHPSHFEERKSETAYYSREGIPECMPEEYRCPSVVGAYQMYYMVEKMGFARYKIPVDSK